MASGQIEIYPGWNYRSADVFGNPYDTIRQTFEAIVDANEKRESRNMKKRDQQQQYELEQSRIGEQVAARSEGNAIRRDENAERTAARMEGNAMTMAQRQDENARAWQHLQMRQDQQRAMLPLQAAKMTADIAQIEAATKQASENAMLSKMANEASTRLNAELNAAIGARSRDEITDDQLQGIISGIHGRAMPYSGVKGMMQGLMGRVGPLMNKYGRNAVRGGNKTSVPLDNDDDLLDGALPPPAGGGASTPAPPGGAGTQPQGRPIPVYDENGNILYYIISGSGGNPAGGGGVANSGTNAAQNAPGVADDFNY